MRLGETTLAANDIGELMVSQNGEFAPALPIDISQRFETHVTDNDVHFVEDEKAEMQAEIAEVRTIALGANVAYVFDTYQQVLDWLDGTYERPDSKTPDDLNVGNLLLIIEQDVPDYWWDGESIQQSETEKVDLSGYATKQELNDAISEIETVTSYADLTDKPSINGKILSGDVSLSASDVGAATAAQGAKADTALQSVPDATTTTKGIAVLGVTGIKGNSESTYRTGQVNMTAANIGAIPTSGGTLTDNLIAASDTSYSTQRVRNIAYSITDLTTGSSSLANGNLYFVYE